MFVLCLHLITIPATIRHNVVSNLSNSEPFNAENTGFQVNYVIYQITVMSSLPIFSYVLIWLFQKQVFFRSLYLQRLNQIKHVIFLSEITFLEVHWRPSKEID